MCAFLPEVGIVTNYNACIDYADALSGILMFALANRATDVPCTKAMPQQVFERRAGCLVPTSCDQRRDDSGQLVGAPGHARSLRIAARLGYAAAMPRSRLAAQPDLFAVTARHDDADEDGMLTDAEVEAWERQSEAEFLDRVRAELHATIALVKAAIDTLPWRDLTAATVAEIQFKGMVTRLPAAEAAQLHDAFEAELVRIYAAMDAAWDLAHPEEAAALDAAAAAEAAAAGRQSG